MSYKTEYKNIFTTFPDLTKIMFHINHYISNMNKAKTGIFFCHNLDLLLFNISSFKSLIKHSTKRAENVLYYPFSGKMVLSNLEIKTSFHDFVNNLEISNAFSSKNVINLFNLINKNISLLNTQKQTKDGLLTCFDNIEKYLWVMYTIWKIYIDEYEKTFQK